MFLEALNVCALYFFPDSKYANSTGVFTAWERSKRDPEIHAFVRYLVNWVAGVKLMFLLLLAVIVLYADEKLHTFSLVALALATASFFGRLFPIIRKMDKEGQIEPKNYSFLLGAMIVVFVAVFVLGAFAAWR
jgi:hypothetical protein